MPERRPRRCVASAVVPWAPVSVVAVRVADGRRPPSRARHPDLTAFGGTREGRANASSCDGSGVRYAADLVAAGGCGVGGWPWPSPGDSWRARTLARIRSGAGTPGSAAAATPAVLGAGSAAVWQGSQRSAAARVLPAACVLQRRRAGKHGRRLRRPLGGPHVTRGIAAAGMEGVIMCTSTLARERNFSRPICDSSGDRARAIARRQRALSWALWHEQVVFRTVALHGNTGFSAR